MEQENLAVEERREEVEHGLLSLLQPKRCDESLESVGDILDIIPVAPCALDNVTVEAKLAAEVGSESVRAQALITEEES